MRSKAAAVRGESASVRETTGAAGTHYPLVGGLSPAHPTEKLFGSACA